MKPKAYISDWYVAGAAGSGPLGEQVLYGRISDHPRQAEFKQNVQRTSLIVKLDIANNHAETLNTIYTLKEPKVHG